MSRCTTLTLPSPAGQSYDRVWDAFREEALASYRACPTEEHLYLHLLRLRIWFDAAVDRDGVDLCWGTCPHCGSHDGYLNLGRGHWFVCHRHQVRWLVGENLFSNWRTESEEDWELNWACIGSYREIDLLEDDDFGG